MNAQEELIWLRGIIVELMVYPDHNKKTLSEILAILTYKIDHSYKQKREQ